MGATISERLSAVLRELERITQDVQALEANDNDEGCDFLTRGTSPREN